MIRWLRSLLHDRRVQRAAISAALAGFRDQSDERPIRGMTRVVASDAERLIVQVCFGNTRPPRRAWFAVRRQDLSATPLTLDEVSKFYEVPAWR